MKIVITTGIYPPKIGGPAQYAKNLTEAFGTKGHQVKVMTYKLEKFLPTGVRHLWFYIKAFFGFIGADVIFALDTFSVGWPSVCAAKLLGKKVIIRTGGDFLWEDYVERTGDLVLLKDFYPHTNAGIGVRVYNTWFRKLSFKERLIYKITKDILRKADKVIFSTDWQRQIWQKPYDLDLNKIVIVENYYGKKETVGQNAVVSADKKIFVGGTRPLKWKNLELLEKAFLEAKKQDPKLELDISNAPYDKFQDKIKNAYAVVLVSLGDISPNLILDAIRLNKPFILTKENGLCDRIKDVGILVDPNNQAEIVEKIEELGKPEVYDREQKKIQAFNFTHSWSEIADEFLNIVQ